MFKSPLSAVWRFLRVPIVARFTGPEHVTTIELQQWLPVILLAGVVFWYSAAPTAVTSMALVALSGMLGVAFAWAWTLARNVRASRSLRYTAMQVGDELEEAIALENDARLPVLWAEVVDRSNLPGYDLASVRAADARSEIHWRAHTLCKRRGRFTLGPWELRLGDPFRFFLVRQQYYQPQEVYVYPPLAALPAYLLPHTPTLGERHLLRQPLPSPTINAASTRPHVPGDPLRHIHWRSTARRNALHTKVFEPESTSTVWLIADFDPAAHLGEGDDATEETLVMLAASLAAQLMQKQLSVGLLAAEGDEIRVVPPRPGMLHLWEHLRALTPLYPQPDTLTLAQVLARVQSLISARDLILVLTPALNAEWPRALTYATQHGARAEAILLDPASFGGTAQAEPFITSLAALGVAARLVRRGEVRPIHAALGELRRWEFITLGTGRAVARQTPRNAPTLEAQLAAMQARAR